MREMLPAPGEESGTGRQRESRLLLPRDTVCSARIMDLRSGKVTESFCRRRLSRKAIRECRIMDTRPLKILDSPSGSYPASVQTFPVTGNSLLVKSAYSFFEWFRHLESCSIKWLAISPTPDYHNDFTRSIYVWFIAPAWSPDPEKCEYQGPNQNHPNSEEELDCS